MIAERKCFGKTIYKMNLFCYNEGMKRVIEVEGMCCARCAERAEKKLMLLDGVTGAKAKFKKGLIFIECETADDKLKECVENAGFSVKNIRERQGLFS